MRNTIVYPLVALMVMIAACSPEDRSSEVPLVPTVSNTSFVIEADSCLLKGEVLASPNSSLKGCGFEYGNDTLKATTNSEAPTMQFVARTRSLRPGTYYAVAFAENGMGKAFAPDSMFFTIPE